MSDKAKQIIYTVLSLIVIVLYFIGIIMMICRQTQNGITLWVVSTVIGALILYVRRTRAKIKANAEAEEAEELERMKGEKPDADA